MIRTFHLCLQVDRAVVVSDPYFGGGGEHRTLPSCEGSLAGHVVAAEHDILRGHDDRLAVGGAEDVVGRHHQHPGLHLGLDAQRHVDRHLVTVEVGVEGCADERVKLDGLAFDEHRFEGLNAQAMEGGRPVQQNRVLLDDVLQDVPDLGLLLLDHLLRRLDGSDIALLFQLVVDEGLEEFEGHDLRQAALVKLELRPDNDHGAARVVDALTEEVLPETALLSLQHVAERLEGTLVWSGDDLTAAAVVEQRVDRLLEHSLLVPNDDLGRVQLLQSLQAIVSVDDAPVEVIEVRGGETASVERDQRT